MVLMALIVEIWNKKAIFVPLSNSVGIISL